MNWEQGEFWDDEEPEDEAKFHFDGETYDPELDQARLSGQVLRVWEVMQDHHWRTLGEIEMIIGDPQASISARLRDLRKKRFGEHEVERRRRGEGKRGLFEYRVDSTDERNVGS